MKSQKVNATRTMAITAGISYVFIFILSITTNFFIFDRLLVSQNIIASLQNIQIHQPIFRVGIALWMLVIICDTLVAWALFILFSPAQKSLAMLSASLRLLFVGIFACSLLPYYGLMELSSDSSGNAVMGKTLLVMAFYGVRVSYVFFGLHIFTVGLLTIRSGLFHNFAGVLLWIAATGYLADSFLNFLSPGYSKNEYGFILVAGLPALVAELTLTLELLFVAGKRKFNIEG
jgi:hypothetical protein